QILEEMHTGSAKDIPIPRQNYFIYEMCTRTMPYLKSYRRGAEVLLATLASITPLSIEETFPITVLCALMALGLSLGFISLFLKLRLSSTLYLQLIFLSSFYLLEAHLQGSLALIVSL